MPKFVMVQPDDSGIFLTPEFVDQAEAQTFATANGIGGTIQLDTVFALTPFSTDLELEQAKELKADELEVEGDRRAQLVDPHFLSAQGGLILSLAVNATSPLGSDWAAVGVAFDAARIDIDALPNLAAVAAYDVVTDPSWP